MTYAFLQGIRLGLLAGGIFACLGLSAYQERDSVRNDTMEGAESLGMIGTTKLTVTGELELRYYYDEDFYSFVPAGDTLTWSATVPGGLIANQTFVVILTENFEVVQLLLGPDYFSRSGVTTVVPGQTYYVHCTSSGGHGSYTFSLQTNKNQSVSPTLRTISVSGAMALVSGESANYSVLATYSDGSTKNMNADEWKISSGSAYASIDSSGRLTAKTVSTPQTVTIQAKFGGKTETMTVTISPLQVIKPDLVPGAPNGWSAPLVVSTDPYDVIGGRTLLTSDALYFHYSVRCDGTSANVPFDVVLSVDGEYMVTFTIHSIAKDGFGHNDYGAVIPSVVLPAGRHVVKIVIDSENNVVESNESNNSYETVIDVLQTYSIFYYAGAYGRGTCEDGQKLEGRETVLAGSVFERTGYVQKGWSLYDGGPRAYRCGEVYRNDETLILYPYWEPNEYDIIYDLRGGHERGLVAAKGVYDREFSVSAPEREGYKFSGWCVTDGLDPTTAKWVKTHDPEAGPKVEAEVPVLKMVAIRTTTEYTIDSPKMRCVGSVDGVERFKNLTTRPGGAVTLTATWEAIPYTLVYAAGGGSGEPYATNLVYDSEHVVEENWFVKKGATFLGWTDETGNTYQPGDVVSNLTAVAEDVVTFTAKWDDGRATDEQVLTVSGQGWHEVSFPVLPTSSNPADVFAPVADKIGYVTYSSKNWSPTSGGTLTVLEIGKGYWVQTTAESVSWTVTGQTNPDVEIALKPGWNLIGYPLLEEGEIETVLATALATGNIRYIYSGSRVYPGTLTTMTSGKGYWVYAEAAGAIRFDVK